MIFVLCLMMLLMAICASVLVAASASAAASTNRITHNRLVLGADSIHKNIMYSLQKDDGNIDDQLWGKLIWAVYEANDNGGTGMGEMNVEMSFSSGRTLDTLEIESLVFSFPMDKQNVNIFPAIDGVSDTGIPRIPKTAEINITLAVKSKVKSDNKTLTTVATYEFTGGRLSDFNPANPQAAGTMAIIDSGEWRLISYEHQGG